MKNILIADDHAVIRTGLILIIQQFLPHALFDEAGDGDSAFEKIKIKDYDLIMLDVTMPGTDSFGLVVNILSLKPATKILMFSMNDDGVYAKRYLKMGVRGYVRKDEPHTEIQNAVTTVLNNKRYMSQRLGDRLMDDIQGRDNQNPFDQLSPREFEIVQHLLQGESLNEICGKLTLHSSTVGTHKARIFEKLRCKNIIKLNALAKMHSVIAV